MEKLFGPGIRFWESTAPWTVGFLLLVAMFVPRSARMPGLEERKAEVRWLFRLGCLGWLAFHVWGASRLWNCRNDLALLGAKATAGTYALGFVRVGQPLFAGWACLAGTAVLSGIVLRGSGGKRWKPPLLLIGFAGAILLGVLQQPSDPEGGDSRDGR